MATKALLSLLNQEPFTRLAERYHTAITAVACESAGPGLIAMLLRLDGRVEDGMLQRMRRIPGVKRVYNSGLDRGDGALVVVVADRPIRFTSPFVSTSHERPSIRA